MLLVQSMAAPVSINHETDFLTICLSFQIMDKVYHSIVRIPLYNPLLYCKSGVHECRQFFLFLIRKTCLCNVYPLNHLYIVKLGYAGIYLFFLFLLQIIDCGYLLEPPLCGGSKMYPQSMF